MFPTLKVFIEGLDVASQYLVMFDVTPMDDHRYKYHNSQWVVNGHADGQRSRTGVCRVDRLYIHPDSPASGSHWTRQTVSFHKIKLTNNSLDQNGHVRLAAMYCSVCNAIWCKVICVCDIIYVMHSNVAWYSVMHCNVAWYSMMYSNVAWYSMIHSNVAW